MILSKYFLIGIGVLIALIAILSILLLRRIDSSNRPKEVLEDLSHPWRRAGRDGERLVQEVIRRLLTDDDILLTNVMIETEGRRTELDNIIINNRGVFIIEAKNYSGTLSGAEDDSYWHKTKTSSAGNNYDKQIINPIRQVKRQVYLLAQYLKEYGCVVWVCGYVLIINAACPTQSELLLRTDKEIDSAIHHGYNNRLTRKQKELILKVLEL